MAVSAISFMSLKFSSYSFYSEPLFCSLGIAPFVTAIVIGVLSLCGGIFITLFIEKVQK